MWEIATMYPPQGSWTEEDYLALTEETNRQLKFDNGNLGFSPMPTLTNQLLLIWLGERFLSGADLVVEVVSDSLR